ncbi:MAG: HlyD family efflux transporter periplasmic adaptor subunit [Caldilineaceae bacterium]
MKRVIVILVVIAVVGAGGWWALREFEARQAAQETAAADDTEVLDELNNIIWASGNLEPVTWAALNPLSPGLVTAIYVQQGDWVETDDVLVALDDAVSRGAVEQAAAALAEAEAALAKLKAGASKAEIAAAEAQVALAEAQVSMAAGRMLEAQSSIDAAEAQVQMARREYAEMASHPTATERTAAQAEIAVADAAVRQAQAAYNLVRGNPQIGALPESRALNEATAALEAAKERAAVVEEGATSQQLAVAASAIDVAAAQVDAAQSQGPGSEANLQAAMAQRAGAQAALDKLLEGATAEDIAMAEARVQSAQAALNATQAQMRFDQIVAPFAGQVGEINVRLGELTPAETDALVLGDTASMVVKTTDLRETDVVLVQVGMPVEVTFDALPDRVFTGTVTEIAPLSTTEQGSTNYTATIDVADLDPTLRWGMTAFVNIQVER